MSPMRKLARDVARASSRRKVGNNDLFHQEFERIWRLGCGYPQFSDPWNATKKHMKAGKKTGHRRSALMRMLRMIKKNLAG